MLLRTAGNAFKRCSPQIFRFQGCLLAKSEHRTFSSHRTARAEPVPTIPASTDDKLLVSLFNQPKSSLKRLTFSTTGLFGHPNLTHPSALSSLAEATLIRAEKLTQRILDSRQSRSELFQVIKNLDRLSDLLCGVIDLAELVRHAHPDRAWVEAADNAYETMCEYMNVLNTHVGLYDVSSCISASTPAH